MAKIKRWFEDRISFWCPGCNMAHDVQPAVSPFHGVDWAWNGDHAEPTLSPSILIEGDVDAGIPTCHSNITNGLIEFLPESTHELAGQTVELPEWRGAA